MFENFRDKWIDKYELDPAHFLSVLGLTWKGCLKKANENLELLTDNDMYLGEECAKQHIDTLKLIINT